jgi:type I restriction enzyme M protein
MNINGSNDKSLESWIWDAACSIRGAKEAPKYKDYILPLIFVKRLCDVFDDELNRFPKVTPAVFPLPLRRSLQK